MIDRINCIRFNWCPRVLAPIGCFRTRRYSLLFAVAVGMVWLAGPAIIVWAQPESLQTTEHTNQLDRQSDSHVPSKVYVGIYVLRIPSLSLLDNEVKVDFYLWFRWDDPRFRPYETFEAIDAIVDEKEILEKKSIGNMNYACLRVSATMTVYWDLARYPFDRHDVDIKIEDSVFEESELQYVADDANCSMDDRLELTGWVIEDGGTNVGTYTYTTNFGEVALPPDTQYVFSRFIYTISLHRPTFIYSFKLLYGLYLAVLIGFCSLLVKPKESSARFRLCAGAVFTIMGNHLVVVSNLPESNQFLLIDRLHIYGGLIILTTIYLSAISLMLWERGREKWSEWLDTLGLTVLAIGYFIFNYMAIA